jgi:hypothetical protein
MDGTAFPPSYPVIHALHNYMGFDRPRPVLVARGDIDREQQWRSVWTDAASEAMIAGEAT